MQAPRPIAVACFGALALLVFVTEIWLAPLRPGGSLLALKALPLAAALPALWRGGLRAYQWWSMLILGYLCLGVVRGVSDRGLSAALGWAEAALSAAAFVAILAHVRANHARSR
jgi:uncharacterized membrane protein